MKHRCQDFLSPPTARSLRCRRGLGVAAWLVASIGSAGVAYAQSSTLPADPTVKSTTPRPQGKNAAPGASVAFKNGVAGPGTSAGWAPQLGAVPGATTSTAPTTPVIGATAGPTLSPTGGGFGGSSGVSLTPTPRSGAMVGASNSSTVGPPMAPMQASPGGSSTTVTAPSPNAGPRDPYGMPRFPMAGLGKPADSTADPNVTFQTSGNLVCIGLYCEKGATANGSRPGASAAKVRMASASKAGYAAATADSLARLTEIVPAPGQWAEARRESGALGAVASTAWNAPAAQPGSCVPITVRPAAEGAERVRVDFTGDGLIQSVLQREQVQLALVGTRYVDADMTQPQAMCVPQAVMREIARLSAPPAQAAATQLKRSANGWVLSGTAPVR